MQERGSRWQECAEKWLDTEGMRHTSPQPLQSWQPPNAHRHASRHIIRYAAATMQFHAVCIPYIARLSAPPCSSPTTTYLRLGDGINLLQGIGRRGKWLECREFNSLAKTSNVLHRLLHRLAGVSNFVNGRHLKEAEARCGLEEQKLRHGARKNLAARQPWVTCSPPPAGLYSCSGRWGGQAPHPGGNPACCMPACVGWHVGRPRHSGAWCVQRCMNTRCNSL